MSSKAGRSRRSKNDSLSKDELVGGDMVNSMKRGMKVRSDSEGRLKVLSEMDRLTGGAVLTSGNSTSLAVAIALGLFVLLTLVWISRLWSRIAVFNVWRTLFTGEKPEL